MEGDWEEVTVGEIADSVRNALVGGPFGSNLVSRDYVSAGVPVIRGQNLSDRWVSGEFVFVTDTKAMALSANLARPGDIVFTQRGTLGQVSVIPDTPFEKYLVSQSQMKLTVNRKMADPLFYFYVFSTFEQKEYIRSNAIQTGVPHINLGILRAIPVPLPPLSQQRGIARILGTLDDKIELNRRMNETLEAMAGALFKSWFVDFDPVHAKSQGHHSSFSEQYSVLFPDSFEDSELGEIPTGWSAQPLSGISNIYSGGTPGKSVAGYWNGDLPWISPKVMTSIHVDRSDQMVTAAAVGNGTRLVPQGSVLIMVRGMGLHQGVRISQAQRKVTFNQDVKACVPKWGDGTFLLFALLSASAYLFSKVQASGHGTGVLPTDILEGLSFAVPPADVRDQLTEPLAKLNARMAANSRASRTLTALRDTLLPKLISGELRVKAAEKMVEAVA